MIHSPFKNVNTKREEQLPFYITSIGTTPQECRIYRPYGIDCFLFLYTNKGSGKTKIYDNWIDVPEKSLMILPPNTPHIYEMTGDTWETYWISFDGWGAKQFFDVDAMVVEVPDEINFAEKFHNIYSFWCNNQRNLQTSAYLYSLLIDCKCLIPEKSGTAYKMGNKLKPGLDYIHNNYMNVIELSYLAEICGVTREHLCRVFKQYTGMRPFEYITKIRLQKSKEMLVLYRNMNINEIAYKCGFQSNSYFSSVFRKSMGITPEEYRKIEYNIF